MMMAYEAGILTRALRPRLRGERFWATPAPSETLDTSETAAKQERWQCMGFSPQTEQDFARAERAAGGSTRRERKRSLGRKGVARPCIGSITLGKGVDEGETSTEGPKG